MSNEEIDALLSKLREDDRERDTDWSKMRSIMKNLFEYPKKLQSAIEHGSDKQADEVVRGLRNAILQIENALGYEVTEADRRERRAFSHKDLVDWVGDVVTELKAGNVKGATGMLEGFRKEIANQELRISG